MNRFSSVLYVAEPAVNEDSAMARAVALAETNQTALTVLDVVPVPKAGRRMPQSAPSEVNLRAVMVAERQRALESLAAPYRGRVDIHVEVRVGKKFLEVIRAVLRDRHGVVLKPAEDPGWLARLFGSDDMHLLRKCPCPVWLLKPEETTPYGAVVAALDFDPLETDAEAQALNRTILDLASAIAIADGAALHLIHAWDAPEADFIRVWADDPDRAEQDFIEGERRHHEWAMDAVADQLRASVGADAYDYLAPRKHLPQGAPEKAIPRLAEELQAGLVVMGTVARTGIPGVFIGNTAEAVLYQLRCSVLAIKPDGFVSPVTLE